MELLQLLYYKSPIFVQNLMTTISGYQKNSKRYGKIYYEQRDFLKGFDQWTLGAKKEYQQKELISLVEYTNENSQFYKDLYKNINMDEVLSIEDLKLLPIVDKEMLRENIGKVVTVLKKDSTESHTGGTTV